MNQAMSLADYGALGTVLLVMVILFVFVLRYLIRRQDDLDAASRQREEDAKKRESVMGERIRELEVDYREQLLPTLNRATDALDRNSLVIADNNAALRQLAEYIHDSSSDSRTNHTLREHDR